MNESKQTKLKISELKAKTIINLDTIKGGTMAECHQPEGWDVPFRVPTD